MLQRRASHLSPRCWEALVAEMLASSNLGGGGKSPPGENSFPFDLYVPSDVKSDALSRDLRVQMCAWVGFTYKS